uniref:Protein MCM10 homolog n=1 Tax=Sphenodon punctatus TaxID=8508 RepID=A0A8D0HII0_SPHPU
VVPGDEELELLASLLEENETAEGEHSPEENGVHLDETGDPDEYDELFDTEDDASYTEEVESEDESNEQREKVAELFGDVADLSEEEEERDVCCFPSIVIVFSFLDEMRKLQEQMKKLQEQLQVTVIGQPSSSATRKKTPGNYAVKNKSPLPRLIPSSSFQPLKSVAGNTSSVGTRERTPQTPKSSSGIDSTVSMETFSGLRLRKPRVSSVEMERKMGGRKLIRLSQMNKCLFQGKTFSIWHLNDLRDLSTCISLFLFGDVHKEHWKTDQRMVIGLLNANSMKPKEGSDEVCLSVDHPQKILLLGEAMDMGTCKARKKNGEPCTQMVNLNDCEYCQYHVQSQYKRLSAKRADLQSSFSSGRVPKKTARKNSSLKEKLCQDGFYYGGVSSAAYAASIAAAAVPKKKIQTTLSNLVVKGADAIVQETRQKMAWQPYFLHVFISENIKLFPCLNICIFVSAAEEKQGPAFQSISASALIKQQKQQILEARKKRSEEIQRFLQNTSNAHSPTLPSSSRQSTQQSPTPGAEFPKIARMSTPQAPRLGTGYSEGDDILFFDVSPPPVPKLNRLADAKKLAAINKLRTKGQLLAKTDPNGVKRKRSDLDALKITERVEKNSPPLEAVDEIEPAQKKRREQLAYLESEEFQKILNAKSKHMGVLKEAEAELQERYFGPLVTKEQMEEKMRSIKELKCRVVTCKTCKYTYYKLLETCVQQNHEYHWHDGVKRFFKCPCGGRALSLDRLPKKHCSTCGLYKWERDGMLKEKKGPKIGGETLLPRGEEQPKFLNSMK